MKVKLRISPRGNRGFTQHLERPALPARACPHAGGRRGFGSGLPQGLTPCGQGAGFTLIELLVVISIIGVLSSVVLANLQSARLKANIARAQSDLKQLATAIGILEIDTNLHPNKIQLSPCVQDPEVYLNSCTAGIQCTDAGFPGWAGPYMNTVPLDPWGTNYFFDSDYQCTDQNGCQGIPSGTWTRVIVSFGPNKSENYGPGSDDIVSVLCR